MCASLIMQSFQFILHSFVANQFLEAGTGKTNQTSMWLVDSAD